VRTIVALPGDGVGTIVLNEAVRVLDAVGFEAEYVWGDIGWKFWCAEGNALPERTLELITQHKIALFGAITSKPKSEAEQELSSHLKGQGLIYTSPIVGLRQHFGLDICMRPCRSYPGNPLNFIRRGKTDQVEEPQVDVVIFRQNTEGLYGGVEWSDPPEAVYQALSSHPKFAANFDHVPKNELSISTRIFSREATRRILLAAFEHAEKWGYPSVTLCEKPNVIRETSGMMYEMAKQIHRDQFPNIELRNTNIDAQMMWLTKNPEDYGVIVAGNMFGDIVSDGFAGLVGGLGFASSAQYNLDTGIAVFEPTHGSAPRYASLEPSIVNPIAMINSACMMLDYVNEDSKSKRIRSAVSAIIAEGEIRTYDMAKLFGGPPALKEGAVSTSAMTDAIISRL
jgi:3-isopropylmalate dehydrogenase